MSETTEPVTAPPTQRPATPDDPACSCGQRPRVIYITERFGEVPSCR